MLPALHRRGGWKAKACSCRHVEGYETKNLKGAAMKYAIPKCPECGETLQGECDFTPGVAEVSEVEDEPGTFEYTGSTEMFWDGQQNEHDVETFILAEAKGEKPVMDKLVKVQCPEAHIWLTEVEYD